MFFRLTRMRVWEEKDKETAKFPSSANEKNGGVPRHTFPRLSKINSKRESGSGQLKPELTEPQEEVN